MTQFVGKTPIHPYPCPACPWPSCDVDDRHLTWRFGHIRDVCVDEWPIHLCNTHRPHAAKIIALARATAFLPVVP